jgi:hypothetical protein
MIAARRAAFCHPYRLVSMVLAAVLLAPQLASAYLKFTFRVGGQTATLRWARVPVRWFATDRGVPGVSAADFQAAMTRAFATWEAVPTASIRFQFAGFTGAEPGVDDDISVLGFRDEPGLERVLGATGFVVDAFTGEIIESDIFFNAAFAWSTSTPGDPARFDLESVAVHEIGHFLGLGHSALGETELQPQGGRRVLASGSVMFPISMGRGRTLDRELQPDDIAGVSDLYPDGDFRQKTGVARGRVLRGGNGVFGAHVVAFNQRTGEIVAGFSLTREGEFEIAGLAPGPQIIRVEPLDDADIDSFFGRADPIDIDFGVTFYERLFIAPAGGVGEHFTVTVTPK